MRFSHNKALVEKVDFLELSNNLTEYIYRLQEIDKANNYTEYEGSINLPTDNDTLIEILKLKETLVTKDLRYIFVVGIGGSNLGTKGIYDALYGYKDLLDTERFPKIIFVDTTNPNYLDALIKFINKRAVFPNEVILNIISKSGETTETIYNAEILLKQRAWLQRRTVVTTDYDSKLWKECIRLKIPVLPIPAKVGGRYSTFSPVGLFPLACAGINIENLLKGALEAKNNCLDTDVAKNKAVASALHLFINFQKGFTTNVNFFFNTELESLGKWYRMLMAESLGKEFDLEGRKIRAGITPEISLGSIDLHSMEQLYIGGPRDKYTTFVYHKHLKSTLEISEDRMFKKIIPGITGKNPGQIIDSIYEGVKKTYEKLQLPYNEVILEKIDEKNLGEFMQFKMFEMMYLGKLFNINTFDQPSVTLYKEETRKILAEL